MAQVPVHNGKGEVVGNVKLRDDVFAVPMNQAVVHQALVRHLANARQGTSSTKTRSQVAGGGRKPFRQKGTGRARRGSESSPLLRGGGVIFGPHPRDHRQGIPKKMRRLALRCVLSAKATDNEMVVVDKLKFKEPKTSEMAEVLEALGVDTSVLIVTDEPDINIYKSARNIEGTKILPATMLNIGDLLSHRKLLLTKKAVRAVEGVAAAESKKLVKSAT
jgi:large subunit ribosomal protein L4